MYFIRGPMVSTTLLLWRMRFTFFLFAELAVDLCSCTEASAEKGSINSRFMALLSRHLEIFNFWQKDSHFHFVLGPKTRVIGPACLSAWFSVIVSFKIFKFKSCIEKKKKASIHSILWRLTNDFEQNETKIQSIVWLGWF